MINSNDILSYRFGVIAAYCSNFGNCVLSLLWGLRDNVRHLSWAYWKTRSGLLLVLIELFSLRVTAEAPRAKIDKKSAISLQRGHFEPKFQVERVASTNNFCTVS